MGTADYAIQRKLILLRMGSICLINDGLLVAKKEKKKLYGAKLCIINLVCRFQFFRKKNKEAPFRLVRQTAAENL